MRDRIVNCLTAKNPHRLLKAGLIVALLIAAALTQGCGPTTGGLPGGAPVAVSWVAS